MNNTPVYVCRGLVLLLLILILCAGHAYRINARRAQDDPQKLSFHFGAIWLAPITWPLLLLASLMIFIVRIFIYMFLLVIFTIGLLIFRKPFLFVWLDKIATKIGNKLLEANTFLIKVAFGKPIKNPQT